MILISTGTCSKEEKKQEFNLHNILRVSFIDTLNTKSTILLSMKTKERLYISDFIEDPILTYPSYYSLSKSMHKNEMLQASLEAIHTVEFSNYHQAKEYTQIFQLFDMGGFPIYKEHYVVGYFGGRMMYLESYGWKTMPITKDAFSMENWLIF